MRRGETAKIMSLVGDYADLLVLFRRFAAAMVAKAATSPDEGAKRVGALAERIVLGCTAGLAELLDAENARKAQLAKTPLSVPARACLLLVAVLYFYYSLRPHEFRAALGITLPANALRLDDYNHIVASMLLGYSLYAVFTGQRP